MHLFESLHLFSRPVSVFAVSDDKLMFQCLGLELFDASRILLCSMTACSLCLKLVLLFLGMMLCMPSERVVFVLQQSKCQSEAIPQVDKTL